MKRVFAVAFLFAGTLMLGGKAESNWVVVPRSFDIPPGDPCWPGSPNDYQNQDGTWTCSSVLRTN